MCRIAVVFALGALAAYAQLGLSLDLPTAQVVTPGAFITWTATATNLDASPATISAYGCGSAYLFLPDDPSGTTLPPQASVTFSVLLSIGVDALPGTYDAATLCVTSDLGGSASENFFMQIETPAPNFVLGQYGGPGSPTEFFCGLFYFDEYRTVFSVEPAAGGVGTGPYLGLYASDPNFLIDQLLLPPDTPPFRYRGSGFVANYATLAAFTLPPGITIEWVTIYPRYFGPPSAPPFLWTAAQRYVTY